MDLSNPRKRKAKAMFRKAKRRRIGLKAQKRVKRNARSFARGNKARIDKAQSIVLRKIQRQMKRIKPELQFLRHFNNDLSNIPAAASGMADATFKLLDPVVMNLKIAGDDGPDTAGDRGWVRGQQLRPLSEFYKFVATNTNAGMDTIRFYFIEINMSKVDPTGVQTLAGLKGVGNPKWLIDDDAWSAANDPFDAQGVAMRPKAYATETLTTVQNEFSKQVKILAIREFHLPGNNNGHRNHVVKFSFGHRYKGQWMLYKDQQDGAVNYGLAKGKMLLVYCTTRKGYIRLSYHRQFKYTDA